MWWPAGQYPTWTRDHEFWVAHYTTQPEPKTHESWGGWRIWQYTEAGKIAGIPGKVDLNWFNGDAAAFEAWVSAAGTVSFSIGDFEDMSGQPDAEWAPTTIEETEQPSRAEFAADE
jgi:lysozyme